MAKRLPPHGGSKIYEGKLEKEHDEGALPHKRNNSVTEEGVVRPSSEEKGLELFGLGSQAPSEEQEHEQKEEKASWLASAPPRCMHAQSEGRHNGGSPHCAAWKISQQTQKPHR